MVSAKCLVTIMMGGLIWCLSLSLLSYYWLPVVVDDDDISESPLEISRRAKEEESVLLLHDAMNAQEKLSALKREVEHNKQEQEEQEQEKNMFPPDSIEAKLALLRKDTGQGRNEKRAKSKQSPPLNIVLLYADDMRHDSLGISDKNGVVYTPFLDSLARNHGIRFTHNCVTTSICWMSRATLHTGLYASQHKGWMPEKPYWYRKWSQSFPFLMKHFRRYAMAHVGKWDYLGFHELKQIREAYSFSRIFHAFHWYPREEVEDDVTLQTNVTGQPRYETNYKTNANGEVHTTDRILHDALQFLQHRPKNQPFMLTTAFFAPHSVDDEDEQFFPQPETMPLYNTTRLKPPFPPDYSVRSMNDSYWRLPNAVFPTNGGSVARARWHLRFDEETKYDRMLKNYYRLISGIDAACKRICDEIEKQGIWNNTLIIFTTDNGFYHGEHGLAGKWFPHEESIRVPLVIVDPRAPASTRGTVIDDLTLNIDLAPTLLNAAKTSIPSTMQGRDMAELYLPQSSSLRTKPWRTEFYYEHPQFWGEQWLPASSALVRKDMKYIQWGLEKRAEQLFDLRTDPREEQDISRRPEYAQLLASMRQRYEELQHACCADGWNVTIAKQK